MQTILVTGGAGYIGSHVCKALAGLGYTPVAYDNLVHGHEWAVKWGPLERGDIRDRARLDQVFRTYRPKAVMHFAAHAYVGESVENPGKYYNNNVAGSLTLLEAMRDHQVNAIVFSSTCATYGIPSTIPIAENHPQEPINPYGASKSMVERMLADFHKGHGIRSISLRYFNAAGADPEGEIGQDHNPATHLVPLVLEVAARRRPHVTIFGTDYDTPDGICIRDYVHVTDLAAGHVIAVKRLQEGGSSKHYNLGNGLGLSVTQVVETAERITGKRIPVIEGARRPGDPLRLVADVRAAAMELGWQPQLSEISDILRTAWAWHLKRWARAASTQAIENCGI